MKTNTLFPFTVAACDNNRSFPMRSFSTLPGARYYASQQGGRPFIIAKPSGAIIEQGRPHPNPAQPARYQAGGLEAVEAS